MRAEECSKSTSRLGGGVCNPEAKLWTPRLAVKRPLAVRICRAVYLGAAGQSVLRVSQHSWILGTSMSRARLTGTLLQEKHTLSSD